MSTLKDKPIVYCLMGPTASGKTELAIELAYDLPIEIINVDSAQVYQGMYIGSGMPETHIRKKIPHHLIDFLPPTIPYNAAQFRKDAMSCIQDILQRKRIPLLVGGTMLYFKALQEGLSEIPSSDPAVRLRLERRKEDEGLSSLYADLNKIDPVTAQKVKMNDTQRILRALEVFEQTGKPMSFFHGNTRYLGGSEPYCYVNLALLPVTTSREVLHKRIETRFDRMLAIGLVAEAEKLKDLKRELSPSVLRAVGYRQIWQYLSGEDTYDIMRQKAIIATRQLAKRQLTWLRSWKNIMPFDFLSSDLKSKIKNEIVNSSLRITDSPQ